MVRYLVRLDGRAAALKFDDFSAGQVLHAGPRVVSEAEIIGFARRYDPQPFHTDPQSAPARHWGGVISSGWLTCCLAMEMAVNAWLLDSDTLAAPGIDELRWERPVRPGDALSLTVTILEKRLAGSGSRGLLTWRWELHNQRAERVLQMRSACLFRVSPGG
jgi:acyl dehydratase